MEAARVIACMDDPPLTFHPALNTAGSNQNHPKKAMPRMGISARSMVQASRIPMTRAPLMLAKVSSQMTPAVAKTLAGGLSITGMKTERYPTAATAMAMLPIQLPNQ